MCVSNIIFTTTRYLFYIIHKIFKYFFEWVYGTMHIAGWSEMRVNMSVFKILMVEPNRSTWSPYEYLLANRILYFFRIFLLFFKIGEKSLDLKILDHISKNSDFLPILKNIKQSKKYKIWFLSIYSYENHFERFISTIRI